MKRWFALIVALQVVFVLAEWGNYTIQAESGAKVVLKALPVDPRSLFMGNYMALDLTIERIDLKGLEVSPGRDALDTHDTVYVGLMPGQPYAKPVSVSKTIPSPPREGIVYMRGLVVGWDAPRPGEKAPARSTIWIDYGIERFYFDERRQEELLDQALPRPGRPANISVTVSVPRSGQPILRKLHINGKTVEF